MTNEFDVIGERKDDDLHLLVRDDDGQHYDYSVANEQVSPVEPDERWKIDREPPLDEEARDADKGGEMPIG
jgi:hypothetical protein